MDKEEAEALAQKMLSFYAPENERQTLRSFTGILMVYGKPIGGTILTKEAAEHLLAQINEHPERASVMHANVLYAVKRAWLEEEGESGRVMAEYERGGQ